jgi:hypothetical protein
MAIIVADESSEEDADSASDGDIKVACDSGTQSSSTQDAKHRQTKGNRKVIHATSVASSEETAPQSSKGYRGDGQNLVEPLLHDPVRVQSVNKKKKKKKEKSFVGP